MKNLSLVSIVLPAYNVQDYLRESLQSIIDQTYGNMEIIIIDDGSTDNTNKIINSFKDKRIKYIRHKSNKGLIYSLNEGINKSTGKYIARMDADDISNEERIEEQVSYLEKNSDVGVCASWVEVFDDSRKYIWKTNSEDKDIKARLLFETPFAHSSAMIRKIVIDEGNIKYEYEYLNAEDFKFWSQLSQSTKFHAIRKPLLKYRLHINQVGKKYRKSQLEASMRIRKEQLQNLGISPTKNEVGLHELLSNWKDVKDFNALRKWLNTISRANKIKQTYNQVSLEKILLERWIGLLSLHEKNKIKKIIKILNPGKNISIQLLLPLIKNRIFQ